MSDKPGTSNNQGAVIGVQGTMSGGTFTQNVGAVDFAKLASQLALLQAAMTGAAAVDPTLAAPAEAIGAAKQAADQKQEAGVLHALREAGGVAFAFATKVAEKLAVEMVIGWMRHAGITT